MSAEQRAELRHLTDALPTIIYHSDTLWFNTSHERIEQLDADPVAAEAEEWPTGPGYDVQPDMGAFIEAARAAVPELLDAIDRVLALHVPGGEHQGIAGTFHKCQACFNIYPCSTVTAIEGAS